MTQGIKDKVVVITGASSGLGEAAARHLAQHGAKLVLGARRLERLQALVAELSLGNDAAVQTDVTQYPQVKHLVDHAVQSHGRIDVIINNAGLMPLSPLERGKVLDWDRTIDVNIKGVLYGIAAVHESSARWPRHQCFIGCRPQSAARNRRIRRNQTCGTSYFRGTAAGGQTLQHQDHPYLAGCGRDRIGQQHHRTRHRRERTQALRDRPPGRLLCKYGGVCDDSAGRGGHQ
jgi:NAD(P)-dependent dehydrogenase (short-subunit alcohol dehydrogenase family)